MNPGKRALSLLLAVAAGTAPWPARAAKPPRPAAVRAGFLRQFERPRVPLAPERRRTETRGGLLYEQVTVASEAGVRVPVLLVRPPGDAPRPVIVCLHGLGGNKEGMQPYLERFARHGFVGVALDARYHGDRAGDVQAAMAEAYRTGTEHPYLWDTAWDTWRVMDYLETRPDVDAGRIGVMGISLGGHTTWMVSADPRVKVAVPCIAVCSWRWQLAHHGYTQRVNNLHGAFDAVRVALGEPEINPRVVAAAWSRWLPGIPERYDCQDILAAMAPRPLLILNGDSDPVAPIEGVREAYAQIESAYRRAHAADRLRLVVAERSGHTVTAEQQEIMVAWFDQWLGDGPSAGRDAPAGRGKSLRLYK
jgi:dienelactone hydrolase